jgi:hypothetical protein
MRRLFGILAGAALLASPLAARATNFTSGTGSDQATNPYAATAAVTGQGTSTLTIVLTNTYTGSYSSLSQATTLTGFFFDVSNSPTATSGNAALTSGSQWLGGTSNANTGWGEAQTTASGGLGGSGAPVTQHYGVLAAGFGIGGSGLSASGKSFDGTQLDGVDYGLLGTGAGGSVPSSDGFSQHTPYIQDSVTITLTLDSGTWGDTSNVRFQWGTALTDGPSATPEPNSLVLLGGLSLGGCVAFGLMRRFRKSAASLVAA